MVAELFFTPTSCAAASYIAAYKAGLLDNDQLKTYHADIESHKVLTGPYHDQDLYSINPKGNVPVLVLEDRVLLNESAAVLQWIADQNPSSGLAPANGTVARYLLQSKLSFLSSEVHAIMGPLFNPSVPNEVKNFCLDRVKTKFQYLSKIELQDGQKQFLVGNQFTIADSYLYIILSWTKYLGIDIGEYPVLRQYYDRIHDLDFVKQAHASMAKSAPKST